MFARLDAPMCFVLVLLHVGFNPCLALFRLRIGGARLVKPLGGCIPLRNGNVEKAIPKPENAFQKVHCTSNNAIFLPISTFLNAFMFPGASKPLRCTTIFLLWKSNSFLPFHDLRNHVSARYDTSKLGISLFHWILTNSFFFTAGGSRLEVPSAAVYTLYRWYRLLPGVLGLSYPKCTSASVNNGITQLRNLRKTTSTRA